MADFRDDFFNSGAWNTAQNVASADYQRQKALEEKYNNAKNEMWGDSGILGNIERLRDTFVNTTGSMLRGADISDFTNEWGKEMQDNASLRMANLPKGVDMPHGQGVGAWLSYLSDIDRGALPHVTDVLGSATAMLGPTAISMIPIGRGASLAAKGLSKVPAIARGLENSKGIQQILKDITMGGVSAQYESLAEKGDTIRTLEEMGLSHEEAVRQAEAVRQENQGLLTATNMAESALANPILRKIFPAFNAVGDDVVTGAKTAANLSARASAIRNAINKVPKPIIEGAKIGGSVGANTLMNGYEEGVQNQIQEAHTPTVDENGNFVWKDYQSVNDLMNPNRWSEESWRAAEEGAVGAAGLSLLGHGAGAVRSRLFNRPNTDVDTIDTPQSDNGIPLYNDQHYIITDQVSNPNATEDTLARLNALAHDYEEQFGEKLMVTSLRRDGNGDSWHDSGQAIDIAGGGLETNENGEREWLLKRGEELGLTGLDEYAHPSDHASGGHIHFSNHNDGGEVDNTASDFDTFMAQIGMQESGGNYDAVNSDSGASGKYQIMPENWSAWAEEAGLDPNSEMTPENQEKVARFKLKQYYDKYGDKGALVAWYAGEANAERYVNGETTDIWGREWTAQQDNAPSIQSYVDEALSKNVGGKSKGVKTSGGTQIKDTPLSGGTQIKDTPLEDYLKLFDDGKTENKTYDDYVKLIGNATDEQVMDNAEKAKEEATKNGDIDTYTALDDMISNGDVEGLRNFALSQAQSLNNSEVVSEVNEVTTADDVQTEPVKTFDFSEAIDGLRKFAQSGTPEQQQIAQNALSSNAPLVALQAYNHLSNMATTDAENTVGTEDNIAIGEAINQSASNEPSANLNQWRDIRNNAAERVRQRTSNKAQQIAQQQADNLYSNAPLTAQEQATVNSVLNSADGVFNPQIKNELFNALRNGDNASVRRVINGVPNNIPSQADVNQQAMAEKQKAMDNARLNVNRAMKENYDAFMETLDENEQEFMNFLNEVFYETGKGFKDILDSARNELVLLQQGLQYATNQENVAQEDVAWVNERIGGLQNAIEGLESIAGKAYEFEQRRNELSRQGETGREQSGRNIQPKEITNEIIEIAKAYGVLLKGRLLDNSVPINEKAVDKSLNSENQKEVDHVVERMENIAEKNNVDIEDIKQEAKKKKSLYQQLQDVIAEKTEMLKMYLDYIEKTSGNGIDVVPLNDGSRRGRRVSNNAQWYSDWYEKNKHKHGKMSKRDKLDVAEQMYRGNIEYEPEAGYRPSTQEEADEHDKFIRQANAEMDAINARIEALENAYEEEKKQKKAKAKKSPNKGTSSNAKKESEKNSPSKKSDVAKNATTEKKNTPKTTLSEQESQEGVASEPRKETEADTNVGGNKQIKDSNTKLAIDTSPKGIQEQAKINREKQLELVKTEFPTAKNIKQTKDSIRFTLNNERIRINFVDGIVVGEREKEAYRRDYGKEYEGQTIFGKTETINGEQVLTLLKTAPKSVISHEAFHLAFRTALTQKQQQMLIDKYGSEEEAAEAYRELMSKSNARGTMFDMSSAIGRLFQKIWNFANSLFNITNTCTAQYNAEQILYAIADGSIADLNEGEVVGNSGYINLPALLAAFHGTWQKFTSFSTDKVGSGEGVQAYGWGVYVSLMKETGERYAKKLSEDGKGYLYKIDIPSTDAMLNNENPIEVQPKKIVDAVKSAIKSVFPDVNNPIGKSYIIHESTSFDNDVEKLFSDSRTAQSRIDEFDNAINDFKAGEISKEELVEKYDPTDEVSDAETEAIISSSNSSNAEELSIDDIIGLFSNSNRRKVNFDRQAKVREVADKLSDAQLVKSLEERRSGWKDELADIQKKLEPYRYTDFDSWWNVAGKNMSGRKLYDILSRLTTPKEASMKLLKGGIQGISYYGDEDGQCCVIFNDKAVKILERNGEPISKNNVKLRAVKNTDSQVEAVRKQYEGTDQWLKAPNGKPTNLTEQQWLQVRTPNFKNWFGDWENDPENASKVVDENGEPLVVYHGTPTGGFEVFDRNKIGSRGKSGRGYFSFTTNRDIATAYSTSLDSVRFRKRIDVLNKVLNDNMNHELLIKWGLDDMVEEIEGIELDSDMLSDNIESVWEEDFDSREEYEKELNRVENEYADSLFDEYAKLSDEAGYPDVAKKIREAKLKGVPSKNSEVKSVFISSKGRTVYTENTTMADYGKAATNGEYSGKDVVILKFDDGNTVVFTKDSNSIKSATDNSGDFSTDNNNIKYSRAVPNPNSAESLKKNGDTDTRLDKLPKVNASKLNKGEKAIQQFGKSLGISVYFVVHPDKGFRGVFTHNGEIFINRNSSVPVKDVFIHEFVHWLKASENEAIFDSLSACLENINGVSHAKRLSEYRESIYNGENMTDNEIIEEMICDAISHTPTANKLFGAINDINPSMAEKVLGYMKHLWDKLCKATNYRQDLLTRNQKLPNKLSAEEMANINATLHNLLMNVKGQDGKPVFMMKNGKMVVRKTGKLVSDTHVAQPINDTVEVEPQQEQAKQKAKPTTEETASTDTKGMVQKATKALAERLGFRVEADKNVTVNRKSTNPQDINVLKRMFMSPSVLGRYNKLVAPLVSMAKSATEKQEKLRYEFRDALNEVDRILGFRELGLKDGLGINEPNYEKNKEALNEILINGDMAGREYSQEELRKQGYNEQVIKAYTKMRQTLNKAWKMLDDITSRMKFGTRNLTEGELLDLQKKNPFLEITSVSAKTDENGRKKYTYKYPTVDNITEHLLAPELAELRKNPDVKVISAEKLSGEGYTVKYVQRRRIGKIEGYVPHIFHEWSVVEVDNNGKILKDENGNSKFLKTFNSMNDAIKFANKQDKSKKYKVMPKLHEVPGASERSAIIEDYNYLKIMDKVVEDFTLTPSEAVDLMNSGIKTGNRGRFLGNLMKRKGVEGYEKDMMYATYQYLNQVGRYVALDPFKRLAYSYYEKMFGAWEDNRVYDGELGQSAKWARMYIDSVNGVPTSVEKNINNALHALGLGRDVAGGRPAIWLAHAMTYPMTISLLGGGNVSSALLNITQLCNLFGAMGDMSVKSWKKLFKNSYKNYWVAWRNPESEMGKLLWEDLGLRYMLGMDVAGGYSRSETDGRKYAKASALAKYSGGLADLQARVGKLAGKSMFMFRGTDSFGRGVTLLTAYQKAIDEGKTKTEAIRYAKMICDRVNFDYSQADANGLYQRFGVLANVLLQFQKYPMKQLELFYDIFKEQKGNYRSKGDSVVMSNAKAFGKLIQYMTPYMALTGISGVPFIGLASALLGFASGDDDKDLVEEIRAGLRKEFGEDNPVVNAFNYGLLGAAGVDVGKRIGIGDYLSGGTMKQTPAEMLASKSWVAASTAMQFARQLSYGNYAEALKAINPSLGNIWIAANGEVRTTRGRLKYQYQSNWERFVRGMGFTPVKETLTSEQAREDYKNRQDEQSEKQAAIDEFIAHPTPANAKTLNELGITPKSIQTERERKGKNRHEINEETKKKKEDKQKKDQAKGKKPKVYTVQDYQRAIKK